MLVDFIQGCGQKSLLAAKEAADGPVQAWENTPKFNLVLARFFEK
tara:strand:- start:11085 stop:11219 length:135 start_codon:yes stop_codon:yes gene_type:complete